MIVDAVRAGRAAVDEAAIEAALRERSHGHLSHVVSRASGRVGEVLRAKLPAALISVVGDAGDVSAKALR